MRKRAILTFDNVFMGCNQKGLTELVDRFVRRNPGVSLEGGFIVFLNGKHTKMKVMEYDSETLAYVNLKHGKLTVDDVRNLPTHFGGPALAFTSEVRQSLGALLGDYSSTHSSGPAVEVRATP